MAALRAFDVGPVVDGQTVFVKGYYAVGDLGGGNFRWDATSTATDDSGMYIVPDSNPAAGRWIRFLNGEAFNVKMWGAKSDMVFSDPDHWVDGAGTDNAPMFNRAIQSIAGQQVFNHSRELIFPHGAYLVKDTIYLWANMKYSTDGALNSTFVWMSSGVNKDIFVSRNASGAIDRMNRPPPAASGTVPDGYYQTVGDDHALKFDGMVIAYCGFNDAQPPDAGIVSYTSQTGYSCFVWCHPGEGSELNNLYTWGGKYGIRTIGGGAPGPYVRRVSAWHPAKAGFGYEAIKNWFRVDGSWVLKKDGAGNIFSLDNPSCDYRAWNWSGGMVHIQDNAGSVYLKGPKFEGIARNGVVCVEYGPDDWTIGQIDIQGGTFNCGILGAVADYNNVWSSAVTFNKIQDTGTYGAAIYSGNYDMPTVTIDKVNMYQVKYLVEDRVNDYRWGIRSLGLDQGRCNRRFTYNGRRTLASGVAHSSYFKPFVSTEDTSVIQFRPDKTGWWRIATATNYNFGGTFEINGVYSDSTSFNVSCPTWLESGSAREVELSLNRSPNVKSKTSTYNQKHVTKARAYLAYGPKGANYESGYTCYLDVYVDKPLWTNPAWTGVNSEESFIYDFLYITSRTENRYADSRDESSFIKPIFLGTGKIDYSGFNPNDPNLYSFGQLDFENQGFVCNDGSPVGAHLKMGDEHIFVDNNGVLKRYNQGAQVIIVDNQNAQTYTDYRAFFTSGGGGVEYILRSHTGNLRDAITTPRVFVSPYETGNGIGALFSATPFYLTGITVVNAGSGYNKNPSMTDGHKILFEEDYGNEIMASRRLYANDVFYITNPSANSRIISGSGFYTSLFVGDRLVGPNNSNYLIDYVVDDKVAIISPFYPAAVTNGMFRRAGYSLVKQETGFYHAVTDVKISLLHDTPWHSGSGFTKLVVRSTNGATVAEIARTGMSGVLQPPISFYWPVIGTGGFGGALENNAGLEAVFVNNSNVITPPTGSGIARITVYSVKNKVGIAY
jgi:hypothetical protein